eukprot:CAMPEP_0194220110 /NCGR_PEP_ID=MMETSP0156-20130528/27481_1 /TAXON_ID=33649 /ORGANISM="Thalassionema nitzschioides, Strain L26-B" /LENGTH=65 /DNA_ID=CAMNT_0038950009 /DNA_START=46 /DNA_END=240 /DNA_ORIENTATION=+
MTTTSAQSSSSSSSKQQQQQQFPYNPSQIGGDPKCRIGFPPTTPKKGGGGLSKPDPMSLGPCVYV